MTIVRLRGLFFACRLPIHKGRGVGCGVTQATEADKLKSCSALLKARFSGSEDLDYCPPLSLRGDPWEPWQSRNDKRKAAGTEECRARFPNAPLRIGRRSIPT